MGTKPFYLLKQALEASGRAAIAKVSLRQKEHICCLRPYEQGLAMHTMHYPDEIRGNRELELPEEQTAITEAEMGMATMLIDQLTAPVRRVGVPGRVPSDSGEDHRGQAEQPGAGLTGSRCRAQHGCRPDGGAAGQYRGHRRERVTLRGRRGRTDRNQGVGVCLQALLPGIEC